MIPASGDYTQSAEGGFASPTAGIRVVICDPEHRNRTQLRMLFDGAGGFVVVAECQTWLQCQHALREMLPELLIASYNLLPAQWPELEESPCDFPVIVALGGPSEGAVSPPRIIEWISVPLEVDTVRKSVVRVRAEIFSRKAAELSYLLDRYAAHAPNPLPVVMPCSPDQQPDILDADPDRILYLKADKNYVRIYTNSGCDEIRNTMNRLMATLDHNKFVRIHRSVIINLSRVKDVAWLEDVPISVVLEDGTKIRIGPNYRALFRTLTLRECA